MHNFDLYYPPQGLDGCILYTWTNEPASFSVVTHEVRGVATAGDTRDASPVCPTMSPLHQVTADSLSSELTFDE